MYVYILLGYIGREGLEGNGLRRSCMRANGSADPVVSAGLGLAWCAARVAYTIGYSRADKEQGRGRQFGSMSSSLLELALIVMGGMTGYQIVMA